MDKITPEQRSSNMRAIKSSNMKPEMVVRRVVHSMGYRYRLHNQKLPGRPDMVFQRLMKIIQINGCFWHQHSDPECKIVRIPKSNQGYWIDKLARTKQRDKENLLKLNAMGWKVLVLWECEIRCLDAKEIGAKISEFLED
tara:strand:+ start:2358 stop:2777 length:420 start_codon:yes stop_codon:yes gene_type:complete